MFGAINYSVLVRETSAYSFLCIASVCIGLGLIISNRLVEAMSSGSKIHVQSELGKGSSFSFSLFPSSPVQSDIHHHIADLYDVNASERARLQKLRCVYVGESSTSGAVLQLLQAYGCHVTCFESIDAACDHLLNESPQAQSKYDLFVIDLDTPQVHENKVLEGFAFLCPMRMLFLYSHPYMLQSRPNVNGTSQTYDVLNTLSPGSITRSITEASESASVLHFYHHPHTAQSSLQSASSTARSIRKDLVKPFKCSLFVRSILELLDEPFLPTELPSKFLSPSVQVNSSPQEKPATNAQSRRSITPIAPQFPLRYGFLHSRVPSITIHQFVNHTLSITIRLQLCTHVLIMFIFTAPVVA